MQWIHRQIREHQPWKISIAEDLQQNPWITREPDAGGAGFNAQWDAGFIHPVRRAITVQEDAFRDMGDVQRALESRYNGDAFQRVVYTESHDEVANGKRRVPEDVWPGHADSWYSKKRSTLGAGLVFTAPGIPMIFQGQEFLQYGWFDDSKELDWNWGDRLSGIRLLYRDLMRLRRNWFNNTRGLRGQHINVFHRNDDNKVIAFHRWDQGGDGDDVIVLANFSADGFPSYNVGVPSPGTWYVRLNSDWNGYSSDFQNFESHHTRANPQPRHGLACSADVGVGPYSLIILSQ
jgi:1,4-alpha-glucan branching enzyme